MPRMLDLFCGRGGWTKGFLAMGWECVGIDINPQPDYAAEFVRADVLQVFSRRDGSFYISERDDGGPILWEYYPDFVCASSPCEEFSVHGMKHFHPNPKYPGRGIKLFNHTQVKKGIDVGSSKLVKAMTMEEKREYRKQFIWNQTWSTSAKRGRDTAKAATIPESLSTYVAQCATTLIEATA